MNEIKISEFRFLQLCDIENKYYKNFHNLIKDYYYKFLKNNKIQSYNFVMQPRETMDKMSEYLNSKINKLQMEYPKVWINSSGQIMYWGKKDSVVIYT